MAERAAIDGFWLPTLDPRPDVQIRPFGPDKVPVRVPELDPGRLQALVRDLRDHGTRVLAERRTGELVEAVAGAAARLTRPGSPLCRELLERMPGLTGYSEAMIQLGLERMGEGWTVEALEGAMRGEFGDPSVLDGFRPREPGGRHRAYGPSASVHIFSGNIPGVAVSSLIRALCVKSACLGKTAAGEPYLAVCFARALAQVDEELARCVAVTYWPGGSEALESAAFAEADLVIAYGGDRTIAEIRGRVPPTVRFLGYPNRVGAALIGAGALADRRRAELTAEALAGDVVTFDQQGCVAPHMVYLERGGGVTPDELARVLADQLDDLATRLPRRRMSPAESSRIHQLRAAAEMRGATVLASARGTEWTVILEEGRGFEISPLNRVVHLRPVPALSAAVPELAAVGRHLQTVAIAGLPEAAVEEIADALGAVGATRIVPVGKAAWPAPNWHHDGRFQFLDLVRFVDLEV